MYASHVKIILLYTADGCCLGTAAQEIVKLQVVAPSKYMYDVLNTVTLF